MTLVLERFVQDHEAPTFGRLYGPSFSCFTIERPWIDNKPYISCIPAGCYQLRRVIFFGGRPEPYETLEICDVEKRSHIKIHRGNIVRHIQGCVAVGRELGVIKNQWAVLDSAAAFHAFWNSVEGIPEDKIGQIEIKAPCGDSS